MGGLFYGYVSEECVIEEFVFFGLLILVFWVFYCGVVVVDVFCDLFGIFVVVEDVILRENCGFFVFGDGVYFLFGCVVVVEYVYVVELDFW